MLGYNLLQKTDDLGDYTFVKRRKYETILILGAERLKETRNGYYIFNRKEIMLEKKRHWKICRSNRRTRREERDGEELYCGI